MLQSYSTNIKNMWTENVTSNNRNLIFIGFHIFGCDPHKHSDKQTQEFPWSQFYCILWMLIIELHS